MIGKWSFNRMICAFFSIFSSNFIWERPFCFTYAFLHYCKCMCIMAHVGLIVFSACNVKEHQSQCVRADGFEKTITTINRQLPGPKIQARVIVKYLIDDFFINVLILLHLKHCFLLITCDYSTLFCNRQYVLSIAA